MRVNKRIKTSFISDLNTRNLILGRYLCPYAADRARGSIWSRQSHSLGMASGRLIKLLVFEILEFAAFSIPTLVIMEQFATAYQVTRNREEKTHYWLIVSGSIAYVSSVSLLIWVPIKVLLYKKHRLIKKIKGWWVKDFFSRESLRCFQRYFLMYYV